LVEPQSYQLGRWIDNSVAPPRAWVAPKALSWADLRHPKTVLLSDTKARPLTNLSAAPS